MPIKCPVAPLEFAFLCDEFFKKKNMRNKVEISYVTPMSGAFTKPVATKELSYLLEQKNIHIIPDFNIEKVDAENHKIVDYIGKEVEYDLLVTVPTNMGDVSIARSGFGDDLNFVPTHKSTLQSKVKENTLSYQCGPCIPSISCGAMSQPVAMTRTSYFNSVPFWKHTVLLSLSMRSIFRWIRFIPFGINSSTVLLSCSGWYLSNGKNKKPGW
jgi:hypothetical protein